MAMATASTNAAPVTRIPRPRTSLSLSLGTRTITSAPTMGNSVVIVMAEFCQVIPSHSLSSSLDEDDRQSDDANEQAHRVPLHVAGLDELERPAGLPGGLPRRVPEPVDHVAVEPRDESGDATSKHRRAVDDPVQHLLIGPVHRGRQLVAHREDDRPHVEGVDVVAVLEDVPERSKPTLKRISLRPPGIHEAPDHHASQG